jgi:hypothetical protein
MERGAGGGIGTAAVTGALRDKGRGRIGAEPFCVAEIVAGG